MKWIVDRIKCLLGLHVYRPCYSQRQWRASNGAHCYHEIQFSCHKCGKKTKWMRLSRYGKFTKSLGKRFGWSFD